MDEGAKLNGQTADLAGGTWRRTTNNKQLTSKRKRWLGACSDADGVGGSHGFFGVSNSLPGSIDASEGTGSGGKAGNIGPEISEYYTEKQPRRGHKDGCPASRAARLACCTNYKQARIGSKVKFTGLTPNSQVDRLTQQFG